jgi:TIR domain
VPSIFLSYRRDDTSGEAGRLAEELSRRFGRSSVFIDIDAISPGINFEERIRDALDSCQVALVLIGDRWLTETLPDGRRRIDDDGDYVRMEVAAALARPDVTVVPVLVEGAPIPNTLDLPPDLSSLAKRNALELNSKRWRYDIGLLVDIAERQDQWWRRFFYRLPRWVKRGVPLVALGMIAVVTYIVLNPPGPPKSNRLILSPASVAPVVDECNRSLQIGADGNIRPLSCNGKLNVRAWQHVARDNPLVLSLGPDVLPSQVLQAMCSDLQKTTGTKPLEATAYDLAELYYGWKFGLNPKQDFLDGKC